MSNIRNSIANAIVALCRSVDDHLLDRTDESIELSAESHVGGGMDRGRIEIHMQTGHDEQIRGEDADNGPSVSSLVMEMLVSQSSGQDFAKMQGIEFMTTGDTIQQFAKAILDNHVNRDAPKVTTSFVTDGNGNEVLSEVEVEPSFEPFAVIDGHEVSIRTSLSPYAVAFTPDDFRVTKDGVDVNTGEFVHALVMPGITYLPAGRKLFTLSHASHSYHFLSSRGHFVALRTGSQALFWEQLVFAAIDRLRTVNDECPSEYNLSAIEHLEQSIRAAEERQKDREGRGVQGTQQP